MFKANNDEQETEKYYITINGSAFGPSLTKEPERAVTAQKRRGNKLAHRKQEATRRGSAAL